MTKEVSDRRLNEERRQQYVEEGYLAVPDLYDAAEVRAARNALREVMSSLLADARSGVANYQPPKPGGTGNYDGAWIRRPNRRVAMLFEHSYDPLSDSASDSEVLAHVRKLSTYEEEHPYFQALVASPLITGIASQLLGEPVELFQVMGLVKPARIGSEKPWHQDNAYFKLAVTLDRIVGFWLALDDAGVDNGCMHVLPGWHRKGGFKHIHDTDCRILPDRLRDGPDGGVPVPLPAGGTMFFSGMLPHRTPPNESDKPRWAVQFHYRGLSAQPVDQEEYDRLFAEPDGTPASCAAAAAAAAAH